MPREPNPLRLPHPLSKLPWDIAQDQFGVQGAAFIGLMGKTLLGATQDQFRAYVIEKTWVADKTPQPAAQDQIGTVAE